MQKHIPKYFFNRSTIEIAKALLGIYLIHETDKERFVGKIVETEAYLKDDPACHASRGMTERNKTMFEKAGTAYVYFTYGMHHCFNVVTNNKGIGEAALIRAIEPIEGINLMKKNRKTNDIYNLCSGPAKLTQAFQISRKEDGVDLLNENSKLRLIMPSEKEKIEIVAAKRIGISQAKDKLYRFYVKGSRFVT
jgi:DNA-3-methyladenine glycosylase